MKVILICMCIFMARTEAAGKLVCYYVPDGLLSPQDIDTSLCTHIIFGFATVKNNTMIPSKAGDVTVYKELIDLKIKNPDLKIMLSIGKNELPEISKSPAKRTLLVNNSLDFLEKYGFDGLDFDWEFPSFFERKNFVKLLHDFHIRKRNSDGWPLISAAVSASSAIILFSYDIADMANYIDFVNIMCYDYNFFRSYYPLTGHNSPLFKHKKDIAFFNTWNIDWSTNYWLSKGMTRSKIVVGLPTYGHTFNLLFASKNGVYAVADGAGSGDGWITYPEVCDVLKNGGTRVFDDESMVPYCYQGKNWISYDDTVSMTYKAKWVVDQEFAGIMTWNLNSDDWSGKCGEGKFPLHNILKEYL